jgi:hypothetical protein
MNIFTRREVFVSTSLEKVSQMRAKIQSGGVECMMICKNLNRQQRGLSYVYQAHMLNEYRLYVHKDDVELAVSLMNKPGF